MRKLKLQMQQSIDGFVGTTDGQLDWMNWNWDEELKNYVTELTTPVDLILMGRKLAEGFIPYWENAANTPETAEAFAHKMNDTPKVVFSKTMTDSIWPRTKVINGNLMEEVNMLKTLPGNDMIVYGGANFVSNLIREGLIDELHLFVNPAAIGNGMSIFDQRTNLKQVSARVFPCGIVGFHFEPHK